jgi:hypothetical protein
MKTRLFFLMLLALTGCDPTYAVIGAVGVFSAAGGGAGAYLTVERKKRECNQKPTLAELCACYAELRAVVPMPVACIPSEPAEER